MSDKENTQPCPECGSYLNHEPWCPFDTPDEEVWITAKVTCESGKEWELVGVFKSRERAIAACKAWNFCIWPMNIDAVSADEPIVHPRAEYPIPREANDAYTPLHVDEAGANDRESANGK